MNTFFNTQYPPPSDWRARQQSHALYDTILALKNLETTRTVSDSDTLTRTTNEPVTQSLNDKWDANSEALYRNIMGPNGPVSRTTPNGPVSRTTPNGPVSRTAPNGPAYVYAYAYNPYAYNPYASNPYMTRYYDSGIGENPLAIHEINVDLRFKFLDKWLFSHYPHILRMLKVNGATVNVLSKTDAESNDISKDTDVDLEKKSDFIGNNILTLSKNKKILNALCEKNNIKYYDILPDNTYFVRKAQSKYILKKLTEMQNK